MSDGQPASNGPRGTVLNVCGTVLHTIRRGDMEYVALLQLADMARDWGIDRYHLHKALQDTQHSKDVEMTFSENYYLQSVDLSANYSSPDMALVCVDDLVAWSQKVHLPPGLVADIKAAVAQSTRRQRSVQNS